MSRDWKGPNQRNDETCVHGAVMALSFPSWGKYLKAIAVHTAALRRRPPSPVDADGDMPRISPQFVEWMMMLPAGHVTDPAIGISRTQQLKALGNGVVPNQAALAITLLAPPVSFDR